MVSRFNPGCTCCAADIECSESCTGTTFSNTWKVVMPSFFGCCTELEGDWFFTDWIEDGDDCYATLDFAGSERPCDGTGTSPIEFMELRLLYFSATDNVQVRFEAIDEASASFVWTFTSSTNSGPISCSPQFTLVGSCNDDITAEGV